MKKYRSVWLLLMMLVMVLSIGLSSSFAAVKIDKETGLPYMANANKPITFTMFVRDPGQAPAKTNPVLKKITQLTGVTINYEFLVGDLNQKIGVMIAGEDYPDIVFCGDQNTKFIEAGAFIPLENKLKKLPNLNKHYAPYLKYMTAKDGHVYNMQIFGVNCKPAPIFENGGAGFFMQKAVIEENGYKIPHTIDEYFDMIEKYKAKHPDIDGVKTIGFEVLCDGWRDFCLRNAPQHLMGAGNDGDVFVDPKTLVASFYQNTDTAKTYFKKLNEEFNKGIIEAETFTESYDQYISRISTGAVLGMFDQGWDFNFSAGAVLRADKKYNRTYVSVPIANPGVKDGYLDKALTVERRTFNQDSAKVRDLTGATLVNYAPKPVGLYEDGSPTETLASAAEFKAGSYEYDMKWLSALKINYPAQILSAPVKRPAYFPVWAMNIPDGSAAKVANQSMNDCIRKYYPRLIMAQPAEYDALWEKFLEDFKAANGQPYLDLVNQLIKERMSIK
jgi:putative aldouronate transport system substrate-binding protein